MRDSAQPLDAAAFLEHAPCGFLQTDVRGRILWANQLFCAWVGRDYADIVGHRRVQDFFSAGGRIFHQTHWVPLMQMQHSVSEVKFELVGADGQQMPVILNAVRSESGEATVHNLSLFIARDRDRYERELVKATERLKTVAARAAELEDIAKDRAAFAEQMMGIVSHDLRTPLSTIELSALAIAADALGDRQQAALARITRASSRAVRLIRDLLDFTQGRLGKGMGIARSAIDLHAIVLDSVEELRAAFPGRELRHDIEGVGRCDADADRLTQLVGNLVSNAVAYGDADAPVVITSRVDQDTCTISVHNMGSPIDAEALGVLFEPMSRGEVIPDDMRSVGLGLYIVREIARAHDGDVTVGSHADAGTTFLATFARCIRT